MENTHEQLKYDCFVQETTKSEVRVMICDQPVYKEQKENEFIPLCPHSGSRLNEDHLHVLIMHNSSLRGKAVCIQLTVNTHKAEFNHIMLCRL